MKPPLKLLKSPADRQSMGNKVEKLPEPAPAQKRRKSDKRTDNWDDYFLEIATAVSRKSKDPNCQVGAVITSTDNLVLSTGFNGLARGVYDSENVLKDVNEKLPVICHAEFNAILNASRVGVSLKGASIYVTKFPCLACCNAIIQAGIDKIYTHDHKYWDDDQADCDHRRKRVLLMQSGIRVVAPNHPDFNIKVPTR